MYELFTIPLLRQRGTFLWSQRTSAKVNTHEKDVRASSLSKATLFGTHESEATFNKQQPCFDARLSE